MKDDKNNPLYFTSKFSAPVDEIVKNLLGEEAESLTIAEKAEKLAKSNQKVDIAVFREGEFAHPWYGNINYTKQTLDKIIANFNKKVRSTEPSVNEEHTMFNGGALGWVPYENGTLYTQDVAIPDTGVKRILFAKTALNEEGWTALLKKKYKYTSAEIAPN